MIRTAVLILVALAAMAFIGWYGDHWYGCRECDSATYVAAGRRVWSGLPIYGAFQSEPYRLIEAARGQGFVYPPSSAVLLSWSAAVPLVVWRLAMLAPLVAVTWIIGGRGNRGLLLVVALLLLPATWMAWANGNVSPLIVAGFGAAFLWPRFAWAIAGVGAAVKLFPVILLVWAYRHGGWRHVAYGLGASLGLILVTLPVTGIEAWPAFIEAYRNSQPNCGLLPDSIRCATGSMVLPAILGAGLVGIALLARNPRLAFAALALAPLVVSPDLNRPYWLFALLAAVVALPTSRRIPRRSPAPQPRSHRSPPIPASAR